MQYSKNNNSNSKKSGNWKRLIDFDFLVQEGVIAAEDIQLFHFSDDPLEAWEYIRQFYQL